MCLRGDRRFVFAELATVAVLELRPFARIVTEPSALYGARDNEHNHAIVLRDFLENS